MSIFISMLSHYDTWMVILNPHAGSKKGERDKQRIMGLLKKSDISFSYSESLYRGHSVELARNAAIKGYSRFIVVGGDGTLNEVLNGVLTQQIIPPEEIHIAMVPVGTGNDWIRTFGIPNDYKKAIDLIMAGSFIKQDIGAVSWGGNGSAGMRYFANMAGFGYDAVVAGRVNKMKDKGRSGKWIYLWSLSASFFNYKTCRMTFDIDGQYFSETVFTASVGIGKYNGGGMMQAPDAIPYSGEFSLTLIRKIGVWGIIKNLRGLYNGSFINDPHVFTTSGRRIKIESKSVFQGEVDGEQLGGHGYTIELLPSRVNVICGNSQFLKQRQKSSGIKYQKLTSH